MLSRRGRFLAVAFLTLLLPLHPTPAYAVAFSISVPSPSVGTVTIKIGTTFPKMVKLQIYVDGVQVFSCSANPCAYDWNTTTVIDGSHSVEAKLLDVRDKVW